MVNYISLVHNCLYGRKWSHTNRSVTWRRWQWDEKESFYEQFEKLFSNTWIDALVSAKLDVFL